ncbi:LacI family transcriptional regulator [Roseitalea porphyridii]|uniref:LacI family transcriptional regulator n=1 Tax=Roseitalea porphyridii TaxID=1852022 RepID=A0A4P6V3C1_9HYPH|nr:LacI family transcriptional regulator [Roseitalea porphyridii]
MPIRKRVTLRDVARETGLALSTVSNALAGKSLVKPETRDYVVETAEKIGYRASVVARSLRSQRSYAIGVLIEDVANPSASAFVRGVEDVVNRAGCTILLANTDGDLERQVAAMHALIDRAVDGLVLISQHLDDERVAEMLKGEVPAVLIQRRTPGLDLDYVGSDNSGGIREALNYVAKLGHKRVGYITGPLGSSSARERLDAAGRRRTRAARSGQSCLRGPIHVRGGAGGGRLLCGASREADLHFRKQRHERDRPDPAAHRTRPERSAGHIGGGPRRYRTCRHSRHRPDHDPARKARDRRGGGAASAAQGGRSRCARHDEDPSDQADRAGHDCNGRVRLTTPFPDEAPERHPGRGVGWRRTMQIVDHANQHRKKMESKLYILRQSAL